jgi:hypothetical protein
MWERMMIALDIKQHNIAEIPVLNLSQKEDEPILSFATLLKSVKDDKEVLLTPKNSTVDLVLKEDEVKVTLPLKSSQKSEKKSDTKELLSLVATEEMESVKKDDVHLTLNPKITQHMSNKELKVVIKNAKEYLKSQIVKSDTFQKQEIAQKKEIASLPKTLKGLSQVAKKVGVDVTKITLETVQEVKEPKATKSDKVEIKPFKTAIAFTKEEPQHKVQVKKQVHKTVTTLKQFHPVKEKPLSSQTPLFTKLPEVQTNVEISTQELVVSKSLKHRSSDKKERSQQTLELLLRGEKISKSVHTNTSPLTADFSVTTAKVVAPNMTRDNVTRDSVKHLESLLTSTNKGSEESETKTDVVHVAKAESFEVKLGEAKQMMKYLSQDIKTAIEDYKSPFTRVKVQLNPQKLGEVDLTIVQRGKNLHINLSSNNSAINTLAMNANDLKLQLNNSGINNATLNFNNTSQMSDGSFGSQTQQQHQQREEAQSKYNYFAQDESNEEILSSLEIIVPHYA